MSNLNSKFTVLAGLPPNDRSAMLADIVPATGVTLTEGMIVILVNDSGDPTVDKLTSNHYDDFPPDDPWLVLEGTDQGDAAIAGKVTCIRIKSGVIWRVETSESFTVGDLCCAAAGLIHPLTGSKERAVGLIVGVNSTSGYVDVACAL